MKGYKVFNSDWKCNGFQYEVGKTYEMKEKPVICKQGFHFCTKLEDCFSYYDSVPWNKIAEVEAEGDIAESSDDSKKCTNKIRIIKEIDFTQIKTIARSDGVAMSDGVARSNGVAWSDGVTRSYGVAESYGVVNSFGVNNALFLANKAKTYSIFGKEVTEGRFNDVMNALNNTLNGWKPTFNNLRSLYLKYGSKWEKTPIPKAEEISRKEAWKDMPQKAVDYVKSLPEYNAEMFEEITGIKE